MENERAVALDDLGALRRTRYCGELGPSDVGREVTLMGWVHSRRDLGNLIFIDLRDRTGLVQVVSDAGASSASYEAADKCRGEYVVAVTGTVQRRRPGTENREMKTGEVEVLAKEIRVLNRRAPPHEVPLSGPPQARHAEKPRNVPPGGCGGSAVLGRGRVLGDTDPSDDQKHP